MATTKTIAAVERNSSDFDAQILQADNITPQNLAGCTVQFYLKTSKFTGDGDSLVLKLSSAVGPTEIEILDQSQGRVRIKIPQGHALIAKSATRWYRVDVLFASGARKTAIYGDFLVRGM